jgi:hypothetical protein
MMFSIIGMRSCGENKVGVNMYMNMHTNMTIGDYRVDAVVVSMNMEIV